MWTTLLAALLAAAPAQQGPDTTVTVDPRARLRMETPRGDIVIHTWSRPEMRVQVSDAEHARLRVSTSASTVTVGLEREGFAGRSAAGDFEITLPATMSISLSGQSGDVHIEGTTGEVNVQTMHGDIQVQGGSGLVQLRSVAGDVALSGARARVEARTVSGDVTLRDVTGDVVAETMNGDIQLERVDAASVQATTVSGDLRYQGSVREAGHYTLSTHRGDISFALPPGAGAVIRATTFSGEFQADMPVQLTEQSRGHVYTFTQGNGSARVELQSFSGDIQLARPGSTGAH